MSGSEFFQAKYDGLCAKCFGPIYEGDWVKYGEDRKVICKPCGEEEEE